MGTMRLLLAAAMFAVLTIPAARATDTDGDGVEDTADVCPNTPPGTLVDASGRPRADLDGDCDGDLDDLALFQAGFTGPRAQTEICGDGLDNDGDGLVDCEDTADCPPGGGCACESGSADCDGVAENGCEFNLDASPPCTGATLLASFPGDLDCFLYHSLSDVGEAWWSVWVTEEAGIFGYDSLYLTVELQSPPGVNYDLYLYDGCGGLLLRSSVAAPGQLDRVTYTWEDELAAEDDRQFWIEARFASGSTCEPWVLRVYGGCPP